MKSTAIMLIGLPCSGKTTFVREHFPNIRSVSSDDRLEEIAKRYGMTYTEAFEKYSFDAQRLFKADFIQAIAKHDSFVIDRTNLLSSNRKNLLSKIPSGKFLKMGIVFSPASPENLEVIFKKREQEGKIIPDQIYKKMTEIFEQPSLDEGFDVLYSSEEYLKRIDNTNDSCNYCFSMNEVIKHD
jgi:predicted kinase